MPTGLNATLAVLAKTKNDAALAVLLPALDSPQAAVQNGALGALLDRRSPRGQKEILRRVPSMNAEQLQIVHARRGKLSFALRDALLGDNEGEYHNACQATLWFREYDMAPVLVNAAEDQSNPHRSLAAVTLRSLCELLYGELSAPRDYHQRRDPQLVRRHLLTTLECSFQRFGKHKSAEIVESFLLLASRDNVVLKQALANPHGDAYLCLVDLLTHSEQAGVLRLLLGFLDDPTAPSAVLGVIARRGDLKFIQLLTNKIGYEPSSAVSANLRRIESVPWFDSQTDLLDELDEQGQHGVVQLATHAAVRRWQSFPVVSHLLRHGTAGGRRAAARALARFSGADANNLALAALGDSDPRVQAVVLSQLRERGIPGAVTHLINLADSPHTIVRQAVRECLSEFTLPQFIANFETLDDAARASTAALVRRVDKQAPRLLADELRSKSRTKRLRALRIARLMELAPQVEPLVIGLLGDSDFMVRCEAAQALDQCTSAQAIAALRQALLDSSIAVQEAAEESLGCIAERRTRDAAGSTPQSADRRQVSLTENT